MSEISILEKLVSFNTIKDKENKEIMDYIETYCIQYGFKTIFRDKILIMSNAERDSEAAVAFCGHTDTVDAQNWDYDLFKLTKEGNKLIGLGACDMKGGIACIMGAIAKIDFSKMTKKMMLIFTYDEEIGFSGIKEVLKQNIKIPEKVIIGEPTNNQIQIGSKGLLEYKVKFVGKKAHSSTPFKGKNAIMDAIDFISKLEEYYESEIKNDVDSAFAVPYTTFNVGMINGGIGINSVADECEIYFDFRTINENEEKIVAFVNKLSKKYSASIEELARIQAFKIKSSIVKETKTSAFITEASFLEGERIILGPGPVNPHEKNEYVEIESLEKCVEQYKELIEKICK